MERGESGDYREDFVAEGDAIGDHESYEDFNRAHGYPDGSRPSVTGPRPVSRHGDTETFALGGRPGAKAPKWLQEVQARALERSDNEAKNKKKHKK